MKKIKPKKLDHNLLEHYDFSKGVRGKYVERYRRKETNVVMIDKDVAAVFPDANSVNQALRALASVIRKHLPKKTSSEPHKQTNQKRKAA